jgi:regulator of microtubule dynamics protein 3
MKKIVLFLSLSLWLSTPAVSSNCDELVAAFDNEEAVRCFEEQLADHPGDFQIEQKLARAFIDAGEDVEGDAAEAWFLKAVDLSERMAREHPESAEGHYYLAVATGRYAQFLGGKQKVEFAHKIRVSVDRALAIDPDHAEALLTRGIYFYELATLNRALRFFAKVIYGGLPEGGIEDAERDLEASSRVDPDNSNALYHLALIREKHKDYEACAELCRKTQALPMTDHLDWKNQALAAELEEKVAKKLGKSTGRR